MFKPKHLEKQKRKTLFFSQIKKDSGRVSGNHQRERAALRLAWCLSLAPDCFFFFHFFSKNKKIKSSSKKKITTVFGSRIVEEDEEGRVKRKDGESQRCRRVFFFFPLARASGGAVPRSLSRALRSPFFRFPLYDPHCGA